MLGSMAAEDMMKAERQRESVSEGVMLKKTASHMVTESGLDLSPED